MSYDKDSVCSPFPQIVTLCESGRLQEARELCAQLCNTHPDQAQAWFLLGAIDGHLGNYMAAATSCRRAIGMQPNVSSAHFNLGVALLNLNEAKEAVDAFRRTIELDPGNAKAHGELGNALRRADDPAAALASYQTATDLDPSNVNGHMNLATLYFDQGRLEKAKAHYQKAIDLSGSDGVRIRLASMVPVIPVSTEEIDTYRTAFEENLSHLLTQPLVVDDPTREITHTNFYLAYHGLDDKPLQTRYAQLLIQACPSLTYTAAHCRQPRTPHTGGKIRVGFISKFLQNHSIGKTSRGIIAHLSRELFEIVVFFIGPPRDHMARLIASEADRSVVLSGHLAEAHQAIEKEALDVLFYQDTGMDTLTFFLAFARLAPVQCTSFGHPVTTGIPNLDYYISTSLWEPEGAQAHYSEKLHCLRDVPSVAYYYKPETPRPLKGREAFGLSDDENIYVCPQALFKFHPDFDAILAGILNADPKGRLILIEGSQPNWTTLLRNRFESGIPDVAARIEFLPGQGGTDFSNLIAVSDVMLDTIHFCGFNTSLEAFAVGTPVVTWPGTYMRSRHTMAFYRKMNIMECVVESSDAYIKKALKLGTDKGYRDAISRKIMHAQNELWEDAEVVREFERFFLSVARNRD